MSWFSHQSICVVYCRVKNEQTEVVDGDTEMLEGFKAEMMDMEMRLRNGGLGGVNNFTDYEKRLENAKTIKELVSNPSVIVTYVEHAGQVWQGLSGVQQKSNCKSSRKLLLTLIKCPA